MADPAKPGEPAPENLANLISESFSKISEIASSKHPSTDAPAPKKAAPRLVREIGPGLSSPLKRPLSLAWRADKVLLVLDCPTPTKFRVQAFTAAGEPSGAPCEFAKGSTDGELMEPVSLIVDGDNQMFIVDAQDACVKKFGPDGQWLDTYRSAGPVGSMFDYPLDAAVDESGNLLIADTNNNRIVQLQSDGELGWILENFPDSAGSSEPDEFFEPCSLCVGRGGILRVADRAENRVLGFDVKRKLVGLWSDLSHPSLVRVGADGTSILVAERNRIVRMGPSGAVTGTIEFPFDLPGDAKATGGGALCADGAGHVMVIDPVRESILVLAFEEK